MPKVQIEVRAGNLVIKYSNQDCANASLRLVTTVAPDEPLELLSPFNIESGPLTIHFLEGSGRRTPLAEDTGGKRGAGSPLLELTAKCRCAVGFDVSKEKPAWEKVRPAHKLAFRSRFISHLTQQYHVLKWHVSVQHV
jgi:hypothetical protein